MSAGRLIAVVGPSGVGKDSVMAALAEAEPRLTLVRRVITRAPDPGGEPFRSVEPDEFDRLSDAGAFCLSWGAHGLRYGIPADMPARVAGGADLLVNLSRGVLAQAAWLVDRFEVLHVTARPDTLAARLAARGRETPEDIAARLARNATPLPDHLTVHELSNDGALPDTVTAARSVLFPVSALT